MIERLSEDELSLIKKAGIILKECMDFLAGEVKEGVSTKSLEKKAEDFITSKGARTAFKGYKGYPAAICTSRNSVVVHGIPTKEEALESGDIIGIDLGVGYKGFYADAAKTFPVGEISPLAKRLISVTEEALNRGIEMARSGNHVGDISWAVQSFVERNEFNVVRAFVGHGIGREVHVEPEVPNFGKPKKGAVLAEGMVLAIEPMVNEGTGEVEVLKDGWTAVTKDKKLSAHFEHTVIVRDKNAEIVT